MKFTCDFGNEDPCRDPAVVALYRLDCPHCDAHPVRAYCEFHAMLIQGRVDDNKVVRCASCNGSKRSKETYKYIGVP